MQCIADIDPDVIALQEVWGDDTTNVAEEVADRLGYQHVFASSMNMQGSKYGNALLSRWPIISDDFAMLFGEEERRILEMAGRESCDELLYALLQYRNCIRIEHGYMIIRVELEVPGSRYMFRIILAVLNGV